MAPIDPRATAVTRARYQRIAEFYDLMELLPEKRFTPWRAELWGKVQGPRILEIGVGTGKNMPYCSGQDAAAVSCLFWNKASPRMITQKTIRTVIARMLSGATTPL